MARCTSSIIKHVWRVCDLRMPRALAFTPTTVAPTRDLSTTLATLNSISIVDLDICGQCDRQKRLITTSGPRKSCGFLGTLRQPSTSVTVGRRWCFHFGGKQKNARGGSCSTRVFGPLRFRHQPICGKSPEDSV